MFKPIAKDIKDQIIFRIKNNKEIMGKYDKLEVRSTKTALAKKLGISRGMLYYSHKKPIADEELKEDILEVIIPLLPDEFQITTNAMSASREYRVAQKAKFMQKQGYRKELIYDLIKENRLSTYTVNRIKRYLSI